VGRAARAALRLPATPERRLTVRGARTAGPATRDDRRVLALAAVFAPSAVEPILLRLGVACAAGLMAEGSRIAALPRRARLLALAEALPDGAAPRSECVEALAAGERPRIRAALRRWADAGSAVADDPLRPAVRRLLNERVG